MACDFLKLLFGEVEKMARRPVAESAFVCARNSTGRTWSSWSWTTALKVKIGVKLLISERLRFGQSRFSIVAIYGFLSDVLNDK